MSFGFSVGDILTVSNLALGICRRVRDSSDQFRDIRGEAANLRLVLNDLAEQMSSGQLSSQQTIQLSTLVQGCKQVLEDLDGKLKKYEGLDTHASSLGPKTGRLWKKLKWDQSEVDALRSRLISNNTSLEIFYSGLASQISHAINEKVDILDERVQNLQLDVEHKDRQAILDWLSSSNFSAQQTTLSSVRQEGAGSWLIESEEFKTWSETDGKTLICQGIPGAGKTMLASLVIDHLSMRLQEGSSGVTYIYCDYRAQLEQTPPSLIASLLKQSLQQQPVIPADVKKACQEHRRAGTRLESHEMLKMLQRSMEYFSRNYVIVDALDELSSQGQVRHVLLKELRNLQDAHGYNLLTTSRHITNLTLDFQEPLYLEIRASSEDIQRYVRGHMTQLPNCVRTNMSLQEAIVSSIVDAVDGMFLLAQLHVDSLKDQTSPKAIKRALKNLPTGSKALDKAYAGVLQRIEDQMEGFSLLAKQVLGWLTYAERLLSVTEIQYAIAVESREQEFDEDNLNDVNELVSVCAGLVVVDDQSNVIRLVHYTTQEYFVQNGASLFPGARQAIAESCLTYLLYNEFKTGWLYEDDEDDDDGENTNDTAGIFSQSNLMHSWAPESLIAMLRHHPFYEYAAQNWATHVRYGVEDGVDRLFLDFARDDHKISCAAQVLLWLRNDKMVYYFDWDEIKSSRPVSAMHLLSYLGNDDLISVLLDHSFEADVKDSNNATPLWWAAYAGQKKVVELLLSRQSVDVNNLNFRSNHTTLFEAVAKGHVEIVKLLIAREDVDLRLCNGKGITPLAKAAKEVHSAVVEVLLTRKDIVADAKCWKGKTPLLYAAEFDKRRGDIVRQLCKRSDVDINATDENGMTVLGWVAQSSNAGLMKMLLACTDMNNADQKNKNGITPLMYAARQGRPEVVELLLSRDDVDVNAKDLGDQTPLIYATMFGRRGVTELLLSRDGVDVNAKTLFGQTPLMWAARLGHQAVTEVLLSHSSVDANAKSLIGHTPLMFAAKRGHQAIVELLLSHKGIDANAKDSAGSTVFYTAAAQGHTDILKLLLARSEIDLGIEDDKGRNTLAQLEEDTARIAAEDDSVPQEMGQREQMQKGRQAALTLLRAALKERAQRES